VVVVGLGNLGRRRGYSGSGSSGGREGLKVLLSIGGREEIFFWNNPFLIAARYK